MGARVTALVVLLAAAAALFWDGALPAPAPVDAPASSFSEARALAHVRALCAAGPRPTGSAAETAAFEVRAPNTHHLGAVKEN